MADIEFGQGRFGDNLDIPITDQNGQASDLTGYSSASLSIYSQNLKTCYLLNKAITIKQASPGIVSWLQADGETDYFGNNLIAQVIVQGSGKKDIKNIFSVAVQQDITKSTSTTNLPTPSPAPQVVPYTAPNLISGISGPVYTDLNNYYSNNSLPILNGTLMARSGSVIDVQIHVFDNTYDGIQTYKLLKNGVDTGIQIVIAAGSINPVITKTILPFIAGDIFTWESTSGATTGVMDNNVVVLVQFDVNPPYIPPAGSILKEDTVNIPQEIHVTQPVTSVLILAKWKISGLNIDGLPHAAFVVVDSAYAKAAMKENDQLNNFVVSLVYNATDITDFTTDGISLFNLSPIAGPTATAYDYITNNTAADELNSNNSNPEPDTMFVYLAAWVQSPTTDGWVKELWAYLRFIIPPDATFTRVI